MSETPRQVENAFAAVESFMRRASAADRAYLLSRGFQEYFNEDGRWRPKKLAFLSKNAHKLSSLFALFDGGPAFLDSFIHDVAGGRVSTAEAATRALVELLRELGAGPSNSIPLSQLQALAMQAAVKKASASFPSTSPGMTESVSADADRCDCGRISAHDCQCDADELGHTPKRLLPSARSGGDLMVTPESLAHVWPGAQPSLDTETTLVEQAILLLGPLRDELPREAWARVLARVAEHLCCDGGPIIMSELRADAADLLFLAIDEVDPMGTDGDPEPAEA